MVAPPTSTIPTLLIPKPRVTPQKIPRIPSATQSVSRIAQRTPSRPTKLGNSTNGDNSKSTPAVPTLRSTSTAGQALDSPGGDVRRSVSIAAFPSPPKVRNRQANSPRPSPSATWPTLQNSLRDSEDPAIRGILADRPKVKKLKTKTSSNALSQMYTKAQSPTLLNKSGDGKSVISTDGKRTSDGLNSLHSPAHSRSSSAQGSCSTSATTFEDVEDGAQKGRDVVESGMDTRKASSANKEGKGNVIVGVRVRPDIAGNRDNRSDGEWLVDGRRSLISYRGREGGDYYYGIFLALCDGAAWLTLMNRQCICTSR